MGNNRNDISNQQFGRLTAKYPLLFRKRGYVLWHCECDCGKSAEVLSRYLCSGSTKSCGCLKRDYVGRRTRDLTNQRFGRLTAKYSTSKRKHGSTYWYCECDCGKGIEVLSRTLCSGKTRSCGCMRLERGFSK